MTEKLLCGVDLGGTKLSVGLFHPDGKSVAELKVTDHSHLENDELVSKVAILVHELLESQKIHQESLTGIGVGMAGHINFDKGLIITSSNFPKPFDNYPFRDRLQDKLKAPVTLDNDTNAQAFGEFLFGAGMGKKDMAFITVSTGVGAGIISDGRILRGYTGFAGEIGHTIVDPVSEIRCTCGNYGCLMALSGGLGLPLRYRQCLKQGMVSSIGISADNANKVDGIVLEQGVEAGDEICVRLFEESAVFIGIGIYNLYQSINPQTVILGGGLMNMGFGFMDRIRNKFDSFLQNMVQDKMEIIHAGLGNRSGLLGAAALPLDERNH